MSLHYIRMMGAGGGVCMCVCVWGGVYDFRSSSELEFLGVEQRISIIYY